ncbi:MAG: terpene cyclase/mutase family protein, partial [Verrucomicrobiales bacterium]|nr:terpene cyclase/mutase family protein [Verrucomicrobiales bacterium]
MPASRIRFIAAGAALCFCLSVPADEGPSRDTPVADSVEEAIEKGIAFLIEDQNENGSWGSPRQTKGLNIYAPVPGSHEAFRTAVTAMAVSALIESGLSDEPGPAAEAREKGEVYLLETLPLIRRATPTAIYNVWTHAYGLRALADMYPRADDDTKSTIVEVMNQQIDRLGRYESVDGGWGYYDFDVGAAKPASSCISFTTATCLVALHRVKDIEGVEIPDKLVQRAI